MKAIQQLTDKIFLTSPYFETDKTHDAGSDGETSQNESKGDALGGPEYTLREQDQGDCVDHEIAC